MKISFIEKNGAKIAFIESDSIIFESVQDAIDLMADCYYQGAENIIVEEKNLPAEFFDLKTRLAGDILQKFSNYRVGLAIVGDFTKYASKSLQDFIYESNKSRKIIFVDSLESAVNLL